MVMLLGQVGAGSHLIFWWYTESALLNTIFQSTTWHHLLSKDCTLLLLDLTTNLAVPRTNWRVCYYLVMQKLSAKHLLAYSQYRLAWMYSWQSPCKWNQKSRLCSRYLWSVRPWISMNSCWWLSKMKLS